jgi:hypothetical protein
VPAKLLARADEVIECRDGNESSGRFPRLILEKRAAVGLADERTSSAPWRYTLIKDQSNLLTNVSAACRPTPRPDYRAGVRGMATPRFALA